MQCFEFSDINRWHCLFHAKGGGDEGNDRTTPHLLSKDAHGNQDGLWEQPPGEFLDQKKKGKDKQTTEQSRGGMHWRS